MLHRWKLPLAAAVLAASMVPGAGAAPYSSVVVFGDSLSDNGNTFGVSGFPPSPPYAQRFSNGLVGVEYMAAKLGLPLDDHAWGGATTGAAFFDPDGAGPQVARPNYVNAAYGVPQPLPNMLDSMGSYLTSHPSGIDSTALYVVWGGANDIFLGQLQGRSPTTVLTEAVTNVTTMVGALLGAGATKVLVPGMSDLGLTPAFAGDRTGGSLLAASFNAGLQSSLATYLPAGGWQYFDTFGLLDAIADHPPAYGFSNVTDPCFDGANVCANPASYLFWDGVHPTTAGHEVLGNAFAAAVPEPANYALLLGGLAVIGALARRRAGSH